MDHELSTLKSLKPNCQLTITHLHVMKLISHTSHFVSSVVIKHCATFLFIKVHYWCIVTSLSLCDMKTEVDRGVCSSYVTLRKCAPCTISAIFTVGELRKWSISQLHSNCWNYSLSAQMKRKPQLWIPDLAFYLFLYFSMFDVVLWLPQVLSPNALSLTNVSQNNNPQSVNVLNYRGKTEMPQTCAVSHL